jgi:GNAT superfamily N-acetyltransferase
MQAFERRNKNFLISTDKQFLRLDSIHNFLSKEAYWCLGIPRTVVARAIDHSLCFGLYKAAADGLKQIGFARVVTDHATFAWICDVYVEEEFRGQGLSKWLMKSVMEHPSMKGLRRSCLATKDAHALYQQFGFEVTKAPENWMEIKDNDIYKK